MEENRDPVHAALCELRQYDGRTARQPNAELEARLLQEHDRLLAPRRRSPWLLAAAVLLLSGGLYAGVEGVQWIRSWWVSVEVEGESFQEEVEGDGRRSFVYPLSDGGEVRVSVERSTAAGQRRSEIRIFEQAPGREEEDVAVSEESIAAASREVSPRILEGHEALHDWWAEDGDRRELFIIDDSSTSRVFLRVHAAPGVSIRELPCAFPILLDGAELRIDTAPGELSLTVLAAGREHSIVWPDAFKPAEPAELRLQSPDDRVKVRVGPGRRKD